jgi:hypothetical protein
LISSLGGGANEHGQNVCPLTPAVAALQISRSVSSPVRSFLFLCKLQFHVCDFVHDFAEVVMVEFKNNLHRHVAQDWRHCSSFGAARRLDRALFLKLAEGQWINARDNLALVGPSGVGKSWLACATGQKACRDNLPSSIIAGRSSAKIFRSRAAMGSRVLSNPSAAPISWSSTTSASSRSMPAPATISRKSLRNGMDADRRSLHPNFPWPHGMRSAAIAPTPTRSWTASCTTRIA